MGIKFLFKRERERGGGGGGGAFPFFWAGWGGRGGGGGVGKEDYLFLSGKMFRGELPTTFFFGRGSFLTVLSFSSGLMLPSKSSFPSKSFSLLRILSKILSLVMFF